MTSIVDYGRRVMQCSSSRGGQAEHPQDCRTQEGGE